MVKLAARNRQAYDDVTFIPLSMMREYLSHFQTPDAEQFLYTTVNDGVAYPLQISIKSRRLG